MIDCSEKDNKPNRDMTDGAPANYNEMKEKLHENNIRNL